MDRLMVTALSGMQFHIVNASGSASDAYLVCTVHVLDNLITFTIKHCAL